MEQELQQRMEAAAADGKALLAAVRGKLEGLSLPDQIYIPEYDEAKFSLEHDKYNGEQTLMASFFSSPTYRSGVLLFHSDGSCFAEFHVMRLHPAKPKWFIESVEAWGKGDDIKTDIRLVEMPQ